MIEVSSADRVVYPDDGFTKGDVVAHYARVADALLPHAAGRPLTLVRHPRGIGQRGFFQKAVKDHYPESLVERIPMPKRGGTTEHASISSADGLCYLANQNAIEFHAILRKQPDLATPDRLVLDLDPPEGDPAQVQRAARASKALLDELGALSTPVASGGKGYHVYVALDGTASGRDVYQVAHILAEALAVRHPELLTIEILKKNRGGRVLVDWMRNTFGATVVLPFSLRARPGAPVAVPLSWDELDEVAPSAVTMATVESRLDTDPLLHLARSPVDAAALVARCAELRDDMGLELIEYDRFGRKRGSS